MSTAFVLKLQPTKPDLSLTVTLLIRYTPRDCIKTKIVRNIALSALVSTA